MRPIEQQPMQPSTLIQELEQLIAIPSHEDCTPILHYLEKRLDFLRWERQDAGKQVGGRPQYNLIHLDPDRPFIVNTHVDTVPPLGMADPFRPRRTEDRIYGRGAVDTKGLLAALTIALEACHRTHGQVPVSVAFTVDEENTSAAGSATLARLLGPDHCVLVLEPSNGHICTRQAGALEFEVRSYGTPRHAALFHRGPHPIRTLMAYLQAAENALQRPLNVLSFQGGWDHYATPPEARALVEVIIPADQRWEPAEEVLQQLARTMFRDEVEYRRVDAENPLDFGHHAGVALLEEAYTEALDRHPQYDTMPSWTDAANFARAGASCVIFGFGDLARAHGPEEYITVAELVDTARVLYRLFTILIHSSRRIPERRNPMRR